MTPRRTNYPSLDEAVSALGFDGDLEYWRIGWGESEASFRPNANPELQPASIREACDWLKMDLEISQVLGAATAMFVDNVRLQRLAWHCRHVLFESNRDNAISLRAWPVLSAAVHPLAGLFYAIVLLSGLEITRQLHHARGIPPEITRDTLADLALWIRHERQLSGVWALRTVDWLTLHFTGRVYKLGRLQFDRDTFHHPVYAYRHRHDGRIVLTDESSRVIRPNGGQESVVTALSSAEWESILAPGDPVLGVHIPATGPMDFPQCGESFGRAAGFFARHFPATRWRAFACTSWLMDDQLGNWLPASSNIVRFQREFYLHPVPGADDKQTFERVFWRRFDDINDAPQDTGLRRTIAAHVKGGGAWRSGGGVIFQEEVPRWGAQWYRRAWSIQ